jgi:thiamine-monophosphate kinase
MREFEMLQHVFAANDRLESRVVVPPGDDLAQIELDGRQLLVGVDQLVAGRHYDPATTPLSLVGRKAVTRSLSDVAAMAGRPVAALVAATLPPDFGEDAGRDLFEAMRSTAEAYRSPLVGGDLSVHGDPSHPLVCTVTVLAEPTTKQPVRRSGAAVGDVVYVTGTLGGSGAGRHLSFEPRIEEAIELGRTLSERLHAMIDISDGLGRDAGHIAEMSSVAIEIDADRLPVASGLGWKQAVSEGEDYELCFTASGDVGAEVCGCPVTAVGRVVRGSGVVVCVDGDRVPASGLGWEHGA